MNTHREVGRRKNLGTYRRLKNLALSESLKESLEGEMERQIKHSQKTI